MNVIYVSCLCIFEVYLLSRFVLDYLDIVDRDKNHINEIGLEERSCCLVPQDHKGFVTFFKLSDNSLFLVRTGPGQNDHSVTSKIVVTET